MVNIEKCIHKALIYGMCLVSKYVAILYPLYVQHMYVSEEFSKKFSVR